MLLPLEKIKILDDEIEKQKKNFELLSSMGMETKCAEIAQEIRKLEEQKQAWKITLTEQIIDRVPNYLETHVLILRYVECKKFSVIAAEIKYSLVYIYKLHRAGLKQFEEAQTSEVAIIGKLSDNGG